MLAGNIENWRLGTDGDDLHSAPYYTRTPDSPRFNRLFAAIYDIFFSKLINLGKLIPSTGRSLMDIFTEKVPGTDTFLVSAELIAFLKWLIFVAAFKDRSNLPHEAFYRRTLKKLSGDQWRGQLFLVVDAWHKDFQPAKRRRSNRPGARDEDVDNADDNFPDIDEFVDPLADVEAPAGAGRVAAPRRAPAAPRRSPTSKSRKVKRPLIRNLCMDTE